MDSPSADPQRRWPAEWLRHERPLRALLATVLLVGILFMPRELYPGDPQTVREETRSILLHGELAVERGVVRQYEQAGEPGQYVVDNPRTGRAYSKYGSMAAWMYLVPMGLEKLFEGELPMFVSPRRVLYLNLYNVALSMLLAASLYRTARRFEAAPWVAAVFVLLCFYTTYMWNYLRAQNSEIFQSLFFAWAVTAFLDAIAALHERCRSSAVPRLWIACGALLLTKVSYIFVGPMFAIGLAAERWRRDGGSPLRAGLAELPRHVVPGLLVLGAWAGLNTLKFGAPWLTGYHAWKASQHGLTGDLFEALPQLALSPQWGLVFCFPVLALALPYVGDWCRREPVAFGAICSIGVVYTILLASLPSWQGQWCYGPRYWLFMLPFISLPATQSLAWLAGGTLRAKLAAIVVATCLVWSLTLQLQVNRRLFFAVYYLTGPISGALDAGAGQYLMNHSYGRILRDFATYEDDLDRFAWWPAMKSRVGPDGQTQYSAVVRSVLAQSNLYWFP